MEYIALTRGLFERLMNAASGAAPLDTLAEVLGGTLPEIQEVYRREIHGLIQRSLARVGGEPDELSRFAEISFYERAIPELTSLILFWIWQNRAPLAEPELEKLVQGVFEGMVGYRLIDVVSDQHASQPEAIALGFYLIRSHEFLLAETFGAERTFPILRKYADLYASVEYIEKRARWKPCPFSWSEANRLGLKAAPMLAVLHLLFAAAGRSESQIEELVDGLCRTCAFIQMSDDTFDMFEDLSNGFETLAASGYFEWNGGVEVNRERVRMFLDQRGTQAVLLTILDLLNSAIASFQKHGDLILSLFVEHNKNRFLRRSAARQELRPQSASEGIVMK